jgi:hypothetical protein
LLFLAMLNPTQDETWSFWSIADILILEPHIAM